jgi:hypothetical protein
MATKFWFCDTVIEKCCVSYEQHVFALALAESRWLQIPVNFTCNQLLHILQGPTIMSKMTYLSFSSSVFVNS